MVFWTVAKYRQTERAERGSAEQPSPEDPWGMSGQQVLLHPAMNGQSFSS